MPRGWLLDIVAAPSGESVVLWLKDRGGAVLPVDVPYAPPFYVTGPADPLDDLGRELAGRPEVASVAAARIRTSLLDPPDRTHPALAVVPRHLGDRRRVAAEIDRRGRCVLFSLYDVDLTAPQLYYIEHDLYPFAPVRWSGPEVVALEGPEVVEYERPPLRTAELAVRVAGGGPGPPFRPEAPIDRIDLGAARLTGEDEAGLLRGLLDELKRQEPDLLVTHGGDRGDLPQLYARARALGIPEREFALGRAPVPFRLGRDGSTFVSYGRIHQRAPAYTLSGRFHIDTDERFVEELTLAGSLDVCRLARLGLQTVFRQSPGTAFSAMEVAGVLRDGVRIPWKKNLPERPRTADHLVAADRGGLILTPPVGLFEQIDEFDFASLFPSIMVARNLSLETLDCPCCPESPHVAPGLGYRSCTLREGIVPRTLRPIVARRLHFKRRKRETHGPERARYDELGKAWKWVLVTSFGYQGYRNARFGRIECHEAINAYARDLLVDLTERARTGGWGVVHGIVDSLWLTPPAGGDPEAWAASVTRATGLPLGYEGRYAWIVFLPDASYGLGVAQRYYGYYAHGEFKVRGLELRRGDTCHLVRTTQEAALAELATAATGEAFRAAIPRALDVGREAVRRLARGEVAREELLLTHRIGKAIGEYRVFNETLAALRRLKAHGIERLPGAEVSYLIGDRGARDWRRRATPRELVRDDEPYDLRAYADLLARSFETLFLPFGWDRARIRDRWGVAAPAAPASAVHRSPERPEQGTLDRWSE